MKSVCLFVCFRTVWYELLSGEWPFKTLSPEAIIWQIGKGMKQSLSLIQASRDVKVSARETFLLLSTSFCQLLQVNYLCIQGWHSCCSDEVQQQKPCIVRCPHIMNTLLGLCNSQNKRYRWNECWNGLKHYICASNEVYAPCIMV